MKQFRAHAALVILLSDSASALSADALLDPTRPPPAWLAAEEARKNPAAKEAAKPADERSKGAPVQLVIAGPTRRFAIVRGELVGSGSDAQAPKLIELKPGEMTIESKEGQETLGLFPGVEKTPPTAPRKPGSKKDIK